MILRFWLENSAQSQYHGRTYARNDLGKGAILMKMKDLAGAKAVENPEGVLRKTLAYNDEAMLCHFVLKKGAKIPLHDHRATQIGFVVRGKATFIAEKPEDEFEVLSGQGYAFDGFVKHGVIALEETEYVEVFVPVRDEFKDF